MRWVAVQGMKLKPHSCVGCGSTGEMTEDGPPEAYFAEGVDINWGDYLYICGTCARILGELRGMEDPDKVKKLKAAHTKLRREHEALQKRHEELETKVTRMLDGAKARKEAKEELSAK